MWVSSLLSIHDTWWSMMMEAIPAIFNDSDTFRTFWLNISFVSKAIAWEINIIFWFCLVVQMLSFLLVNLICFLHENNCYIRIIFSKVFWLLVSLFNQFSRWSNGIWWILHIYGGFCNKWAFRWWSWASNVIDLWIIMRCIDVAADYVTCQATKSVVWWIVCTAGRRENFI